VSTVTHSLRFRLQLLAGVVCLGLVLPAAQAADPPPQPVLRIEAGTHVNVVRAIAVDAAGRWAVTASDDRTARVWDLAQNVAGAVLRVPIDNDAEGRLQAVVITPDGSTVAVAGRTGRSWDGTNSVHLFDRASGALLRRIDTRSSAPVESLALSPDGRLLAAGMGGQGGLRLFDFASGAALSEDTDYGNAIYALDFRADGRHLVAGSADGKLRIYSFEGGRLKYVGGGRPRGGRLIAQARYSPDGQLLALGFEDSAQVEVLSAADLSVVATPEVGDAAPGAFSSLAWSPDGSELWGGGAHRDGNLWQLRVWPRSDFARYTDRAAAAASLLAITTLPGQRVLFASAEPGWGLVDRTAQVQRRSQPAVANFNSLARQFQVGVDARRVRFWYAYRQPRVVFDLASRSVQAAGPDDAGWSAPRLQAPGVQVEGWENGRGPTLNGTPLPLSALETSRCLSIAPDGRSFALGSDERLWNFDAAGRPLWSRRTPAVVWAVNQSADGRLVVTAGQDGAIRWYRARDGSELMALLLHSDRRRWVLWTPAGYFDAAVGAEDLMGWHINRRADARPDFFPLRTLRAQLYRPELIDHALDLGYEVVTPPLAQDAGGRADGSSAALATKLPPVLELAGPVEVRGSEHLARLRILLRTLPDAPVTALRARAEGRPAEIQTLGSPAVRGGVEEREVLIRFNGEPQNLSLMAENRNGLSAPAQIALAWPGAPAGTVSAPAATVAVAPTAAASAPAAVASGPAARPEGQPTLPTAGSGSDIRQQPRLYVLAIGVGSFQSRDVPPLGLTAKDVRDFVAEMKKQQGRLYRSVEAKVLIDKDATRDNIVDGLDWLQRQVTQHDVGMLFVSGHGDRDGELGYIYVPYNFDFDARRRTAVSMKDFQKTLDNLAGKALFFIDTCHSGAVIGGKTRALARGSDLDGVINELMGAESGVVVFSASTGRQVALEDPSWGNGAFTKAVVEGLEGKADFRQSGRVTHKMLDLYITERVKELTKGAQSPVTQAPGGVPDFPLSVVR
jgi:WD40 repeat protein